MDPYDRVLAELREKLEEDPLLQDDLHHIHKILSGFEALSNGKACLCLSIEKHIIRHSFFF